MFGASEDRARQLAYRKRRERIASGSSCSVFRSLSFSSHVSEQSQMSSITEQGTPPSPLLTEYISAHTTHTHDDTDMPTHRARSQNSDCDLDLAADPHRSQMERHRLQAEYLTRVLYDTLSVPTSVRGPKMLLGPATQPSNPKALVQSTTARHTRNLTAPVASINIHSLPTPSARSQLDLQTLSIASPTAPNRAFRVRTMVALRGGGQDDLPTDQEKSQPDPASQHHQDDANPHTTSHTASSSTGSLGEPLPTLQDWSRIWDTSRPYMVRFPEAKRFCLQPAWTVPIVYGSCYNNLLRTLPQFKPSAIVDELLFLFGPTQPATPWAAPAANARRDLYVRLGQIGQALLRYVIKNRMGELLKIENGGADPQLNPVWHGKPGLMLYHLMEATEPPYTQGLFNMGSMLGRSTSAPNPGQQQGYAAYLPSAIC
jgi:hypothetical protein